jgi:BirA family biotin operon repressor/biotin-[acetyl-CoA-carboxylase] ligase
MTIDAVRVMRETSVARVEYHPTLDSTNTRAAECAARGAIDLPLLVVADRQTAGRGRGGNRWWSSPGSLTFSLLIDAATVAAGEERSPLVALAAAVAVVDCVAPLLPTHQVGIYWPNDVYVHIGQSQGGADIPVCREELAHRGRQECLPHQSECHQSEDHLMPDHKLAGILVEVLPDRRHVIGIGLNVNNSLADASAELRETAVTLRDLSGRDHDRTAVLIDLLRRLEGLFLQLRESPKEIAGRADSLCLQRGRGLTLRWSNRTVAGVCRGIAADGAIVLETPGGIETFLSGDVMK